MSDLVVRRDAAWFQGRKLPFAIGRSGRTVTKREGDGATPIGRFRFEFGYFRPDRIVSPRTQLPMHPIGPQLGWSDDPADPCYNQQIRRPHPFRHERLRRADPLYDLVLVFSANRAPITPGHGSALFIHIWRKPRHPTEGCIAFTPRDLLWILERLTPHARVIIQP